MLPPWPSSPGSRALLGTVAALAAVLADESCQARGGTEVRLSVMAQAMQDGGVERIFFLGDEAEGSRYVSACIPKVCAESDLSEQGCAALRKTLLHQLLAEVSVTSASPPSAEDEGLEEALTVLSRESGGGDESGWPWLEKPAPDIGPSAEDDRDYRALRLSGEVASSRHGKLPARPGSAALRVAVLGTHAPLSALAEEHLRRAAGEVWNSEVDLDVAFYGQCYLCQEFQSCRQRHIASAADAGCTWFHEAPERSAEEIEAEARTAAQSFVAAEPALAAVVCFGLVLCHFVFEALPLAVGRLQIFCMNPLQGTPTGLVSRLLESVHTRLEQKEAIFATNAVTSALLAYHLALPDASSPVRAMTLMPLHVRSSALRAEASSRQQRLLLARNFLLLHSSACAQFESLLLERWPGGVDNQPIRWSLEEPSQVAWLRDHLAVVYLPEHPYKNVFNDFYALRLPIFLPSLGLLAWLWPRLKHAEEDSTYDGWMERRIPRVQVAKSGMRKAAEDGRPEPFDLDVDGARKVHHWLRLADFYHFPGVQVFHSLASLLIGLRSLEVESTREAMDKHFEAESAASLAAFQALLARSAGVGVPSPPRLSRGGGKSKRAPFTACVATAAGWQVQGHAEELVSWTVRFGPGMRPPRALRLQVWRPIRVGWEQKSGEANTYLLVGEHRTRQRLRRSQSSTWHVAVPEARRIILRPGDELAWALDMRPRRRASWRDWRRARLRERFSPSYTPQERGGMCLGLTPGRSAGYCGFWPQRRVCNFRAQQWSPSLAASVEAETAPVKAAAASTQKIVLSFGFEMPFKGGQFAVWFLEWAQQFAMRYVSLSLWQQAPAAAYWTFFVCPDPAASDFEHEQVVKVWRKVRDIFDSSIGASMRCLESVGVSAAEAAEAAERFMRAVSPSGTWAILAGIGQESFDAARQLAAKNPVGLGAAFQTWELLEASDQVQGACSQELNENLAPASDQLLACFAEFGVTQNGEKLEVAGIVLKPLLEHLSRPPQLEASVPETHWATFVTRCSEECLQRVLQHPPEKTSPARNIAEELEEDAMLTLTKHLEQVGQVASIEEVSLYTFEEVIRHAHLRRSLDIRRQIDKRTTYEELMTLRQQMPSPDLSIFEDKIRLRRDLLQPLGVAHTPTIYMSNEDPHFLDHIKDQSTFVVKPTHMTESEHVVVVRDGVHLFDVHMDGKTQKMSGEPVDKELLQQRILDAWNKTAYDWECQAVVAAKPGVIVEHLITATMDPGAPERVRVEEARAHVVWGRVMAIEWAIDRRGSTVMCVEEDRLGRHNLATETIWLESWGDKPLVDGESWVEMLKNFCLSRVFEVAERVANGAGADHLRVDLLIEGRCDNLYVSEVELYPAVPFSPRTMASIERRWRRGYLF